MRFAAIALVVTSVFSGTPSAAEAESKPYVLAPGSKWNVDFGKTKCRLARTFGSGPNTHVLFLDQNRPGSGAAVTVAGPSFERFRVKKETSIALGGAIASVKAQPRRAQLGTMRYGIVFSNIDFGGEGQGRPVRARVATGSDAQGQKAERLDVEVGNSISYLTFAQGRHMVRLETGPLGEAFEVLNRCTQEMSRD